VAYRDLREFVARLEKEGELRRIGVEVDPALEITEIADRVTKAGGPALLFERPKGSKIPVLINAVGSERRMNLALEAGTLNEIAERIRAYLNLASPQGLLDKIKMLPKLAELGSFFPKLVKDGPCKEVIRKEGFSLHEFPILKCWPQDGGRYITWPMVITKNPETGTRNVGCYRMDAGVRRALDGNALADPKARRRALPQCQETRRERENGRGRGHRRGSGHSPCRDSACAAGSGRVHVLGILATRAGRARALRDE